MMADEWKQFVSNIKKTFNALVEDESFRIAKYSGYTFYNRLKDFVDAWDMPEKQLDTTGRIVKWTMWIDSMRKEMHVMRNTNGKLACYHMLDHILAATNFFINKCNFGSDYSPAFDRSFQFVNGETIEFVWRDESNLKMTSDLLPGYFPYEVSKKFIKDYKVDNKKEWIKIIRYAMDLQLVKGGKL